MYNVYEVIFMLVNTKDLISLTEANQNFSKVARTVDKKGSVIIMKNNTPHYIVIDFKKLEDLQISANERMESIASRILKDNLEAFKELAR
jgi:antitoxin Phd